MPSILPRSYLFVPANRPERFSKACATHAGAVIIDLEDAVAADDKASARAALAAWLNPCTPVLVRINSADSRWFRDDLALCGLAGVAGIVLPKAERVTDVASVARAAAANSIILPLIESALGMSNAAALARAPRVQRLVFGSIDFQLDLGIDGDDQELLYFRSQLVLLSRLAGIAPPVDGVSTAIDDLEQLRSDSERARRLGFAAKLCIHPKQVDIVNQAFMPNDVSVRWATRVLAAASGAGGGAIAVDGMMVDRPVLRKAMDILEAAGGPAAGGSTIHPPQENTHAPS